MDAEKDVLRGAHTQKERGEGAHTECERGHTDGVREECVSIWTQSERRGIEKYVQRGHRERCVKEAHIEGREKNV